jgi:putative peptidoglycan lipid II flippase
VWGAFALTASSGFAAWIEFLLLRRWLGARIGKVPIPTKLALGALAAAALAGAAGSGAAYAVTSLGGKSWAAALVAIPAFGVIYLAAMMLARVPETSTFTRRLRR